MNAAPVLRFVSGGVLSTTGNLFATENVPLPIVLIEVIDDVTLSRISVSGTVRIVSPTTGATVLGTTNRDSSSGIARFSGITITDATQDSVRLIFQSSDTTIPTLTTALIRVLPQDVSAYGIGFINNMIPQNVTHFTPVIPVVAIEVLSSSHMPDASVSGGQVLTTTSTTGVTLLGAESTFRNGVASFPALQVQGDYITPVELTFTVVYPTFPNLHLKELSTGSAVAVAVKTLFSLRFVSGEWNTPGESRTVNVIQSYTQVVAVVDSQGQRVPPSMIPGTAAVTVTVDRTDTVLTTTTALIDSTSNSATFSLQFDSYSGVLIPPAISSETIKFSFSISDSPGLPTLETGDNQLSTSISNIRFVAVGSYFTDVGQTRTITSGQTLPDILVEVLDSTGSRSGSLPPGIQIEMSFRNNQIVQSPSDSPTVLPAVNCPSGLCTFSNIIVTTLFERIDFLFSIKFGDSSRTIPYNEQSINTLSSGVVSVVIPAFNIIFGDINSGSAVTFEGQPLTVNQGDNIPDITVRLVASDGAIDVSTNGVIITVTPTQALGSSGAVLAGNTQISVSQGNAVFSGLQLSRAISLDNLLFSVTTTGLPSSGKSIRTGRVTVNGRPHHIRRWLPYPTGLVLGELTEVSIAVVDENDILVNDQAFNPPTLSVAGVGITVGTWTVDSNIQSIRITATNPPLVSGNTVTVTVTPVLNGVMFVPSALEIRFILSAADNTVDHSSFIDPYSVPTVAKVRETQSVRIQFLDMTSSAAVDGDAGYTIVSEDPTTNTVSNQVEMLPTTSAATGGIQTLNFIIKGIPRDTSLIFTSRLGQKVIPPLTRSYRVLAGNAQRVVISSISPTPVSVGSNVVVTYAVVDVEGNEVDSSIIEITPLISRAIAPPGDVSLIQIERDITARTLTLRFDGFLGDKNNLAISREATLRLSPTLQTTLTAAERVIMITAGRPNKIEIILLPATSSQSDRRINLGKSTATQVLVTDQFGNLATDATQTDISIEGSSSSSVLFSVVRNSVTSSADNVKIVTFTASRNPSLTVAQPGLLTVLYTPILSGVTFNPTVVSVDFNVVVLLHRMVFNPISSQSLVTNVDQPLTVRAQQRIPSPGISLLMLTSDGNRYNGDPQQPDLSTLQVIMTIDTLPSGSSNVIQGDSEVLFSSGAAIFNNFWFLNALVDQTSSPKLRFTAANIPVIETGVITLIQAASQLRFSGTNSINLLQPQMLFRFSPLPEIAIQILDSVGQIDRTLDGTYLREETTTLRALISNGVAVFHRLSFQTGVGQQQSLNFISEEKSSLTLRSALIQIIAPPNSIELTSGRYLVNGVVNRIIFKVVDEASQDLQQIPSQMNIEIASQNIIKTSQNINGGAVELLSSVTNVESLTGGTISGVFTPLLAFTPFTPINVRNDFVVCPGEAVAVVFDENAPSELQLGVPLSIIIHFVDSNGSRLSDVDYVNCAIARRAAGLYVTPPLPEQATSSLSTTTFFRQEGNSNNINGSISVPAIGLQETTTSVQGVFDISLPGIASLTRTFTVVKAQPSKIVVVSNGGGVIASGGTLMIDIDLQTVSNTVVTDQLAVASIQNAPTQGITLSTTTVSVTNPFEIRATGPPRVENITFTATLQNTNTPLTPTSISLQVVYATASEGSVRSQWYQIFPNFEYSSQISFATDLTAQLTLQSAAAPFCPQSDVCREISSPNVEVAAVAIWPVPPVGNALPVGNIPSSQSYVFRLINIEQSHIQRIEAALRLAHVDPTKFPQMRHHQVEAVRFLGFLNLTQSDVTCSVIVERSICDFTAFCYWNSGVCVGSVCLQHRDEQNCKTESQLSCIWDPRNDTNPKCIPEQDADGAFASDPFGADWWALILLGLLLLVLCCCCAFCFRYFCLKKCCGEPNEDNPLPEGGEQGIQQKAPIPPPPPPPLPPSILPRPINDRDVETGNGFNNHIQRGGLEVKQRNPPPQQYHKAAHNSHGIPPSGQLPRTADPSEKERLEAALGDVNDMITYIDNNDNSYATNSDSPLGYQQQYFNSGSPDDNESVLTVGDDGDVVTRPHRTKHTIRSPVK